MITLTVTDQANGGFATASVSGADSGTTSTVYVQNINASGWVSAGSITGNGSFTLSLSVGYYWAYCVGTVGGVVGVSNQVYFATTDSSQAVMVRMQAAIAAQLASLTMAGNPNATIYSLFQPNYTVMKLPCIFITFEDETEEIKGGTTSRDDIGYPFRIQIVDRCAADYIVNLPQYLLWRQQVCRAFRNQRFTTVPENILNIVQPKKIIQFSQAQLQLALITVRLVCVSREIRGSGASSSGGGGGGGSTSSIMADFSVAANAVYLQVIGA